MLERLRSQIGTAGLVVAIVALVAALGGGAYAASSGSGGGKATASAKAKQGPRGKTGKTGKTGPAGPVGPAGPQGTNGKDGAAGTNGTNGTNGKDGGAGKSVITAAESGGVNCPEGGVSVEVEGSGDKEYVCNGEVGAPGTPGTPGAPGAPGSPWTAGGTLPSGATETGAWSIFGSKAGAFELFGFKLMRTAISFNVPLAAALQESKVVYVSGAVPAECENTEADHPGTASPDNPEADKGYLCVYQGHLEGASLFQIQRANTETGGASTTGAEIAFAMSAEYADGRGTWAVTGE